MGFSVATSVVKELCDGWGQIEVPERGFGGRHPWMKTQTLAKWVQFTGPVELRSTVGSPDDHLRQ